MESSIYPKLLYRLKRALSFGILLSTLNAHSICAIRLSRRQYTSDVQEQGAKHARGKADAWVVLGILRIHPRRLLTYTQEPNKYEAPPNMRRPSEKTIRIS